MTSNQRILVALGGITAGLIVIAAIAAAILVPRYVERQVLRRAAERGIELQIGELSFGLGWVKLTKSRARLIGVSGVRMDIDRIDAELDGRELVALEAEGVTVSATGSLATLAVELGAWSKRFTKTFGLPFEASGIALEWRPRSEEPPWLALRGARLTRTPPKTTFVAEQTRVAGAEVGRVGGSWSAAAGNVSIGFGEVDPQKAPLRLEAVSGGEPRVKVALLPTELERLAGPFALPLPVTGVVASADVDLLFSSREALSPKSGHARVELKGYIPPHPVELDGFVFGDVTTLETDLVFEEGLSHVALANTRVTAGRFVLKGGGTMMSEGDAARVKLDLRGSLPCNALASAAAESRLGRLLGRAQGRKAGKAAFKLVGGSVAVRVQIDAVTRQLSEASVVRSIGVGCGLKPLTLEDLKELGELVLSGDLSRLPEELGRLIPEGPLPIPSRLPPVPPLPSDLPSLKIPSALLPPRARPDAGAAPLVPSASAARSSSRAVAAPASSQ